MEKSGTISEGACVATVTVKGAGEEPGVAEVGETVQVDWLGAPVQASETALENPFIPETCKLYVAEDPTVTVAEVELPATVVRAKSVAAPVRLTEAGPPMASSTTVREPVRLPMAVGAKVTLKEQDAPGAREIPHALVCEKSPVILMLQTGAAEVVAEFVSAEEREELVVLTI